jgi:hypothetical protein
MTIIEAEPLAEEIRKLAKISNDPDAKFIYGDVDVLMDPYLTSDLGRDVEFPLLLEEARNLK